MSSTAGRRRHVPQRTCVGCRETDAKRSLIRLVRTEGGVVLDVSGKKPGRGAYVHDDPDCWQRALAGSLSRALKMPVGDEARSRLMEALRAHSESQHAG